jgi:hypothetical protein
MSNELVDIRAEWIKAVENHIIPLGFEETVYGYARVRTVRQPGQTIIINGQTMQQPGKEIEIRQDIYLDGDGWVADMDESNKVEFTQVRFESYQGDNLTSHYEEAFYWDNPEYFINFFNQVFG